MKAIIPLAGKGTRLRPHTHVTPKPLVHVAGRPVLAYILDDLIDLGISEYVFVIGYLGDRIEAWVAEEYPELMVHYVVQEVQDGTAGAIKLAEPWADEELLVLFADTLADVDLGAIQRLPEDRAGIVWAKEVEDYQRFGVIVTDDEGCMTRIVEKPSEPISRLANIGLYYVRDYALLFEGLNDVLSRPPSVGGEFYLTDAFQYMVDRGARLVTAPVGGWYDCGKVETLLATNRHLLETSRGGVDPGAVLQEVELVEPVRIEAGARVQGGRIGPNVTIERGSSVRGSTLEDTMLGRDSTVEDAVLLHSIVGPRALVRAARATLNVAADSEVSGGPAPAS